MSMLFRIARSLLVIALLAVPGTASAPAWFQALTNIRVPSYGVETAAVCLVDETRTVVADNGEMRDYRRVAYKILTRDGIDLAWLRLSYDQETRVSDLKVWNSKAGGIVHESGQKDATETQLSSGSGALFEDTKSLILLIPQVEVGSIIAYEYERRHRPYVLQDFWTLQERYPILRSRLELQLPANWEFQYRILRHADSPPKEVAKNDWVWELTDLPAIPREEGMPSLANLSALLVVTYFPSRDSRSVRAETLRNWDDFALWTNRLNESRFTPSSEMVEMAQRLATPKALAEFVQKKIRYVAIEIGIGGYQPHLAEETFRNLYGDCKDKVTLFRSLMKALNREVYPVLINADRGGLVPEFPSPLYFNHMIAAVPIAENEMSGSAIINHPQAGRLLLFDPTDEQTPFGRLPSALQGTSAVLVRGNQGFIINTPVGNIVDNRLLRSGDFKVVNESLSGNLSELYWGELAVREASWLKGQTQEEWLRGAERVFGRVLPGQHIMKFAVGGLNDPNPLQEQYSIEAPDFAQRAGELLLFRPALLGRAGQLISYEESRNHPYQFSYVRSIGSSFNFQIPEGYVVEALPELTDFDLPFAHYRAEIRAEGNTLRYTSLYEIKKLDVSADQFGQLRDFYDLMDRNSRAVVVLKRSK